MFNTIRRLAATAAEAKTADAQLAETPIFARRSAEWVGRQLVGLDAPVPFKGFKRDVTDWTAAIAEIKAAPQTAPGMLEAAEDGLDEVKTFSRMWGVDVQRLAAKSIAKKRAKRAEERGAAMIAAGYRELLDLPHTMPEPEAPDEYRKVTAKGVKEKHNMALGVASMALPGVGGKGALAVANTTRTTGKGAARRARGRAVREIDELLQQGYDVVDETAVGNNTEWTLRLTDEARQAFAAAHVQWEAAVAQRVSEIAAAIG